VSWQWLISLLATITFLALGSSQNGNSPFSFSWQFRMLYLRGQHLWTSWFTSSGAGLIIYMTFGTFGVDGAVLEIESTLAGCLVNAMTFLIICYSQWLALIASPRTSSSILAYFISLLVPSDILILLSSAMVYSITLYTSADHSLLISSSKSVSLSFS